jgi:hypothetical protein
VDGGVINDGAAVLDFQLVRVLHHKLLATHILHFMLSPLKLDLHGALESVFDFELLLVEFRESLLSPVAAQSEHSRKTLLCPPDYVLPELNLELHA